MPNMYCFVYLCVVRKIVNYCVMLCKEDKVDGSVIGDSKRL